MAMLTLNEELGRGGMGVVYRAYHSALCKDVAIKFLIQPDGAGGRPDAARFKHEMEVLISLEHPNIVRVLDAGVHEGRLYYAMELLDAQDLREILELEGRLGWETATHILDQLLAALNYIHGKNLVHRDVKPANVMLESTGRAVLMDFGAVRNLDVSSLTQGARIVGTLSFLAPEILGARPASASTDLWSLGVTAYRMLAGRMPFKGSTTGQMLSAIVGKEPTPVAEDIPDFPDDLAAFVHRFLAKDPAQRWRSAAEARAALRSLACMKSRGGTPPVVPVPQRPRLTPSGRFTASTPALKRSWLARQSHWIVALAVAAIMCLVALRALGAL